MNVFQTEQSCSNDGWYEVSIILLMHDAPVR